MKVAILHTSLNTLGGAERVVVNLAYYLQLGGHYVRVFCGGYTQPDLRDFLRRNKIPYSQLPINRIYNFSGNHKFSGWLMRNIFNNFDILNVHNFPSYLRAYYAKKYNPSLPKTIWICHEPPRHLYPSILCKHLLEDKELKVEYESAIQHLSSSDKERNSDQIAVASIDRIIANSRYSQASIKQIYNRSSEVASFGFPLEESFLPSFSYGSYILTVTRLEWHKNLKNLIRGFQIASQKKVVPPLVIIGSGKQEKEVKKFVYDLGLEDKIKLLGFIKDRDLPKWYRNSAFILYLPLDEPLGLVPIEAAYYGKASLVSNHGGPAEVVEPGISGFTVDPFSPLHIAEKILLLSKPQNAREMGKAAQKRMYAKFSFDNLVTIFENTAKSLLKE